ncbi:hypothetical protein AMTRI_Chr07g76740 [Amborella trichopoda]
MIILSWNARGLGDTKHRSDIKLLVQKYRPDIFEGVDAIGASGGLWIIWDPLYFHCVSIERRDRFLAIFLQGPSHGMSWGIVNFYGPVIPSLKEAFLNDLGDILLSHNVPICFGGDFNFISFPLTTVKALSRLSSDHIPLLLNTSLSNSGSKPFRLELVWLDESGVVDLIKATWEISINFGSMDFQLHKKLLNIKHKLVLWRFENWYSIKTKIDNVLGDIQRWDQDIQQSSLMSEADLGLRNNLLSSLDALTRMEEIY